MRRRTGIKIKLRCKQTCSNNHVDFCSCHHIADNAAKDVQEKFDADEKAVSKIVCFRPETDGTNVVVDATPGVRHLVDIEEVAKLIP